MRVVIDLKRQQSCDLSCVKWTGANAWKSEDRISSNPPKVAAADLKCGDSGNVIRPRKKIASFLCDRCTHKMYDRQCYIEGCTGSNNVNLSGLGIDSSKLVRASSSMIQLGLSSLVSRGHVLPRAETTDESNLSLFLACESQAVIVCVCPTGVRTLQGPNLNGLCQMPTLLLAV